MLKSLGLFSGLMATACVSLSPSVMAQAVDHKLGTVHFETSCAPEAAAVFDQGMLYQHSFWYRASQREFNKALQVDPGCGIAYWGIALSNSQAWHALVSYAAAQVRAQARPSSASSSPGRGSGSPNPSNMPTQATRASVICGSPANIRI